MPDAKQTLKGFVGGHLPTRGFYSDDAGITEAFLSWLEAQVGLGPLLRAKMDLDGDGNFEVVELDKLISVGSVNRSVEFTTNKPRFGSCSLRVRNGDQRYTDNWSDALTYFDPASPTRYHMRKCIVELGFDSIYKHKENYWFPIFEGLITEKTEDGESREVTISLIDEWKRVFDYDVAPVKRADDFIAYDSATDTRSIQLGMYWGKHDILSLEKTSKDNQILIPTAVNTAGTAGQAQYFQWTMAAVNRVDIMDYVQLDTLDASNNVVLGDTAIWFWGWDGSWFADGEKQWMRLPRYDGTTSNYTVNILGQFLFSRTISTNLNFMDVDGSAISGTVDLDAYFDTADADAENLDTDIRIAINDLEPNPIKAMYLVLKNLISIPTEDIDASNTDPTLWEDKGRRL